MENSTLEIAATLSTMNLGAKPIEVATEIDSVRFDDTTIHVICVNGEALSYTHSLETVTKVMEVIAREECKRIQAEKGEMFEMVVRKDKEDGTKYTITQVQLGRLWNGPVVDLVVFTTYPISHACLTKKRAVLTTVDVPVESSILIQ